MKPSRQFGAFLFIGLLALVFGIVAFINSNIQSTSKLNFSQLFLLIGLTVFFTSLALYFGASMTDRYYKKNDLHAKNMLEEEQLMKELDDRSLYFLQVSIPALYYGNTEEIENIYSTYFGEDIVTAITSEVSEETGGEINAFFSKVFGVKQAGRDITKIIKNYKPKEETTLSKFLLYQRTVILRKQINIGLEFVRVDFSEYNAFQESMSWFINTYQINLEKSSEELNQKTNELYDKGVEETLIQLEKAKDIILMEEKFFITEDHENYICNFVHPVSDYLSYKGIQLTIKFSIPKANVQKSTFDFSQVVEKSVPLRIFGKVILPIDRKSNNWEMIVNPIAVY